MALGDRYPYTGARVLAINPVDLLKIGEDSLNNFAQAEKSCSLLPSFLLPLSVR